MGEFDDIIPEYIAESTELLETVESGLLSLERGEIEEDVIHTVFRAIHSIKGGAGFVGLTKIEHLAHKMEDLLNLIRNGDMEATPAVTDALLKSLDVLTDLFERVGEEASIDIEGPMQILEQALHGGVSHETRQDIQPVPAPSPETGLPSFDVTEYTLKRRLSAGNVFFIHLNLNQIEARGLTPIQLVNEMISIGEILDSRVNLPETSDLDSTQVEVSFDVLYYSVLDSDLLEPALRLEDGEYRAVSPADFGLDGSAPPPAEPAAPTPAAPEPALEPAPEPAAPAQPAPPSAGPEPAQAPRPAQEAPPAPVAPEEEPPAPRSSEYLTLTLGRERYGVDILKVQEIIGLPPLSRLPRTPEHVKGVMNLRGMVVPVLDLRLKLGLPVDEAGEPVVVVLLVGDKVQGAVVDGVNDVVEFKAEEIQPPPEFVGSMEREHLRGLAHHDDEMVILLELDHLMFQA